MKSLDVLKIAYQEKRAEPRRSGVLGLFDSAERTWYVVDPAVMYPLMVSWIRERIKSSKPPEDGTRIYFKTARLVSIQGWKYALQAKEDTPAQFIMERATALEVARLWFTKLLHLAVGGGAMGFHILGDEKYKI